MDLVVIHHVLQHCLAFVCNSLIIMTVGCVYLAFMPTKYIILFIDELTSQLLDSGAGLFHEVFNPQVLNMPYCLIHATCPAYFTTD